MKEKIKIIEEYVLSLPKGFSEQAHNADHAFRVRSWAVKIARSVNYQNLDLVEAAALMHDISKSGELNMSHGEASAIMAKKYFLDKNIFSEEEVAEIYDAIFYHNGIKYPANQDHYQLLDILRDADVLDLSGAIGIIRSSLGAPKKNAFDKNNIRGKYHGKSNLEYNEIFAAEGKVDVGPTIIDDLNFQLSCYENLKSDYAKNVAKPMHEFMKNFILEVEREVKLNKE